MNTSPTLDELLRTNQLFSLLDDLITQLNLPVWLEDEQGEVLLGQKRASWAFSEPIVLIQGQRIGSIKGSQLTPIIPHLVTYLFSQQMLVLYDELTKIPNRRYGERFLSQEWKRAVRKQLTLSVLLIDIDYFKLYNDYYGHQQGDKCLQQVAQILSQTIRRPTDFVARYGGEEFLIILPDTDVEGAEVVADCLCRQVRERRMTHRLSPVSPYLTISIGMAVTIPQLHQSVESFISRVDQALYRAKAMGRNQYCVSPDPE